MIGINSILISLFTLEVILNCKLLGSCHSHGQRNQNAHFSKRNEPEKRPNMPRNDFVPPKAGWIDPFEMGMNALDDAAKFPSDSVIVHSDIQTQKLKQRVTRYEVHLQRFVNSFLRAVDTEDSVESIRRVKLEFLLSDVDLNILRSFGKEGDQDGLIENVSNVFTNLFSQRLPVPETRKQSECDFTLQWIKRSIFKLVSSPEWTVVSSVTLLLFVTLWLVFVTHSYRLALFTTFMTIFLAGFGFTWMRMYEEKLIERHIQFVKYHDGVPYHCSGKQMAWYENIFYNMFGADCHQYYTVRDISPLKRISPTDVLAETFSSMFIRPATNIGMAYGNFILNVTGSVPWWIKPIAVPLSFLTPLVFTILLLALCFNYRLSLSMTGFHLMPDWSHIPVTASKKQEDQYIEDLSHRREDLQKNTIHSLFSDLKTPMFLVNWQGLKKLASVTEIVDSNNSVASETQEQTEEVNSGRAETESAGQLMSLEDVLESVEKRRASVENCKRRQKSIYTSTKEMDNSSTEDHMQSSSDLASGNQKPFCDRENKSKEKTT